MLTLLHQLKRSAWLLIPGAAVAALWLAWAFLHPILRKAGFPTEISKLGQWADSFGALNALFAALACIAVIATLWTQQEELKSQQKQIDETRAEQHRQRFESSFFQLLGLLRDLRKEVTLSMPRQEPVTGTDALKGFHQLFLTEIQADAFYEKQLSEDEVASRYEKVTRMEKENELGPYFRIIYTILRRISEDALLSKTEKEKYGNLVRSQLSTAEIGLVGLNGLTKQSNNFRDFIIEFRLLKYLPDSYLKKQLKSIYPHATFDPRDNNHSLEVQ